AIKVRSFIRFSQTNINLVVVSPLRPDQAQQPISGNGFRCNRFENHSHVIPPLPSRLSRKEQSRPLCFSSQTNRGTSGFGTNNHHPGCVRSEERRVGKESGGGWRRVN